MRPGRFALLAAAFLLALAGCSVRSISNSGYEADPDRGYARRDNPFYRGELNEFNVLGIDPKASIAEAEIRTSLDAASRLRLPKGTAIMLIQSGALFPDDDLVRGMEKYYTVSVFSGIPAQSAPTDNYAKALRLSAAKGGLDKLVVCWGMIETGHEDHVTQIVSWIPFVGGILPDRTQKMRIRLKVAVVDVRTGQWEVISPAPLEDAEISGRYTRASSDQSQVAVLKSKAYAVAADDLARRLSK